MDIGKHGSGSKITFYCRLVEQRDSDVLFKIKHQLTHLCKIYEHNFEIVPFFTLTILAFWPLNLEHHQTPWKGGLAHCRGSGQHMKMGTCVHVSSEIETQS
jgi:hypothetical protein